jgi:hypothetical protein
MMSTEYRTRLPANAVADTGLDLRYGAFVIVFNLPAIFIKGGGYFSRLFWTTLRHCEGHAAMHILAKKLTLYLGKARRSYYCVYHCLISASLKVSEAPENKDHIHWVVVTMRVIMSRPH